MNIEVLKSLKSRYVPVGKIDFCDPKLKWTDKDAYFYYPYMLVNLLQFNKSKEEHGFNKDTFLLNDSGGFQVISGTCNYDWKQSLEQQLMIGSSRIFAFDKPPLKKKRADGGNAEFVGMAYDETLRIINENIDTAIKQSKYLQEHYTERIKDFFYVMHGNTKELLDYNLQQIVNKIGKGNFPKYFGGACYGSKIDNNIQLTTVTLHANRHFIKKDLPVHFLGAGSPTRMIILVRNKITTFDSGTALTGATYWAFYNNLNISHSGGGKVASLSKDNWPFNFQFCDCPICSNIDYKELIKNDATKVGEYIFVHNVYQLIKFNVFLDSIELDKYTDMINDFCTINKETQMCLEYCDYADKVGFEIAYKKYKHFGKHDKTKQKALF